MKFENMDQEKSDKILSETCAEVVLQCDTSWRTFSVKCIKVGEFRNHSKAIRRIHAHLHNM